MPVSAFDQVAEMASRLPPEEQLKLVADIGERLHRTLAGMELRPRSVDAVLKAAHEPPHLDPADVDELERSIAAGRLRVSHEGPFDAGSDQ